MTTEHYELSNRFSRYLLSEKVVEERYKEENNKSNNKYKSKYDPYAEILDEEKPILEVGHSASINKYVSKNTLTKNKINQVEQLIQLLEGYKVELKAVDMKEEFISSRISELLKSF